jgi:ribose 5-phosphate isomerase A
VKYVTDNGNYIVDCKFISITNPHELEIKLNVLPGVVGTGLFLGLAHKVIVASPPDKIEVKTRGGIKFNYSKLL